MTTNAESLSPIEQRLPFVTASFVTLLATGLVLAVNLMMAIVLARSLGASGSGVVVVALVLPIVLIQLMNLGVNASTTYHLARSEMSVEEAVGGGILVSFALGLCALGLGLAILFLFGGVVAAGVSFRVAAIPILGVPGGIMSATLVAVQLGMNRIVAYNVLIATQATVVATATITVILLGGGPTTALVAFAVAQTGVAIGFITWTVRKVPPIALRASRTYLRRTIPYGAKVNVTTLISFLSYRLDVIIVANVLAATAVGRYAVAYSMAERLWIVSSIASVVLFPRVAAATEEGHQDPAFTCLVLRTVLGITTVAALLVAVIAPLAVPWLFSSDFIPSVRPLQVLAIGVVAFSGARILATDNAAKGHPGLNAVVGAAGVLINVVLNLMFVPSIGIEGAALASTISYTAMLVAWLLIHGQKSGVGLGEMLIPRASDFAALKAAAQRERVRLMPSRRELQEEQEGSWKIGR